MSKNLNLLVLADFMDGSFEHFVFKSEDVYKELKEIRNEIDDDKIFITALTADDISLILENIRKKSINGPAFALMALNISKSAWQVKVVNADNAKTAIEKEQVVSDDKNDVMLIGLGLAEVSSIATSVGVAS